MRIAVVGSGPAGASAGFHLASKGHEVMLMDRASFPRDKRCGDWVTPGAVRAMASMGLDAAALRVEARELAPVHASLLAAPNARANRAAAHVESYCIPRIILDDMLQRRALAAGCRLLQCEVRTAELRRLRRDFDHVIDARGAIAGRANSAGLRAYWTVRREDGDRLGASTVQMFADPDYRLGYGWVFPVAVGPEHVRYNVGVGAAREECAARGRSLPEFFRRFVQRTEVLRRLAACAVEQTRPVGYPVALAEAGNRVAHEGVLRIGDAANLTDPLTGEGIAGAIISGMLVAQAILDTSDAPAAARWQRLYEETFTPDFRVALRLRRLLRTTAAKNAAVWTLDRVPALARRFHDALSGTTRYRDLLSPGF